MNKGVRIWLISGLLMIFFQIIIGGITRLTGSGLSITEWEIVTGTFPPVNQDAWEIEFEKYKSTPQYEMINKGMNLKEFKFIYFWEYIHRLWARLMGFVFVIPFIFFYKKGLFTRKLLLRLINVILLAALVASFGWIMVASGLVERPWVNAYKLSLHLSLALILFGYLLWIFLDYIGIERNHFSDIRRLARVIIIVLAAQIFLGGMMSGMKAGLIAPTWPDMNGNLISPLLYDKNTWQKDTFIYYDSSPNMSMIVQFLHRSIAYVFALLVGILVFKNHRGDNKLGIVNWIGVITLIQVFFGILTVINCKGRIPLFLGSMHQAIAIFLLTSVIILNFKIRKD